MGVLRRLLGNVVLGAFSAVIPVWITAELLPGSLWVWAVFVLWTLDVAYVLCGIQSVGEIEKAQEDM